jgi:hypothetical protein
MFRTMKKFLIQFAVVFVAVFGFTVLSGIEPVLQSPDPSAASAAAVALVIAGALAGIRAVVVVVLPYLQALLAKQGEGGE